MDAGFDVIVCGCGSAGFCAAIAAAREGLSVAVVERYLMPGGYSQFLAIILLISSTILILRVII